MKAVGSRIVVIADREEYQGAIQLAESKQVVNRGVVVAVGSKINQDLTVGQKVLFNRTKEHQPIAFSHEGQAYISMDIACVDMIIG